MQSVVHCGAGSFEKYAPLIGGKKFVITDSNVNALYGGLIERAFPQAPVFVLPAGERSKNYSRLLQIFGRMIECGVTRKYTVIAFGGGVVGDIAGLAASLYAGAHNPIIAGGQLGGRKDGYRF